METAEHARLIEDWRQARELRLRSPTGWLTLVDRISLEEGDNRFPFGTITLHGGVPTLGERLLSFDENDPDSALSHDGRRYELFRRGDFRAVRVRDPAAPARLAFSGLRYFPIDRAYRIVARFERYDPPRQVVHQLDVGPGEKRVVPGLAHFTLGGRALTLEPVVDESARRLFVVFGDLTNRTDTYPAGRFLYIPLPEPHQADELVLDFNMAFNPPCAFTEFASCPLALPHNRLPLPIPAGEKRPEK